MTERELEPLEQQEESVESEEKKSLKSGRKRYGEHLTHFYNVQNEQEKIHTKRSLVENLSERIEKIFQRNEKSESNESNAGGHKLSYEQIISFVRQNKKLAIWTGGGIFLIVLAVLIIPLIPLQIERSAGFAAFQQKNYSEAFRQLDSYTNRRSNDHAAVYTAARAALFSGNISYARKAIDTLYQNGFLSETSGIGYHYALLNLKQPRMAIDALNATIQSDPSHAGARLLRGILLAQEQPDNMRQARDDFLQLVDVLQSNREFLEIEFLHRYIQQGSYLQLQPSLPVYQQNHSSNQWLSVNGTLDGFVSGLQLSNSKVFVEENLPPLMIANLYFAYMLLENNEIAEAKAIMTGLQRNANDSLAVQQLQAFLHVYEGEYSAAQNVFANIFQRQPEDAKTLNNNVVMDIVVNEKTLDINGIVALYANLPQTENADTREWSNSAYFALLAGDNALAKTIIDHLLRDEYNLSEQFKFNQALLSWANGNIADAAKQLLSISPTAIPNVQYYIVTLYEKSGDMKKAIDLIGNIYRANTKNTRAFIEWVHLLYENGDLRWVFYELQKHILNFPSNDEVRYWLGYIALLLEENEIYQDQNEYFSQLQESDNTQQHYYDALMGADLFIKERIEAGAVAYQRAIKSTKDLDQKYVYLMQWAQLYVEHNPTKVADLLRQYQEQYSGGEIFALLAYALADDDAMAAAEYAQRAINDGNSHIINLYAGAALVKIGDFISATPLLEVASRQRPARANILAFLQRAYADAGDTSQAERVKTTLMYLDALLGDNPPTSQISYRIYLPKISAIVNKVRTVLNNSGGSSADALAAYAEVLSDEKYKDKRADILYSQATFEAYLKNYAQAISLFEEALAVGFSDQKRQIDAMLFYAEMFSLEKQHKRAVNVLEQVIEISDNLLLHQRLYAVALARNGEKEAAITLFNDILLRYPADLQTYQDFANIYFLELEYSSSIAVARQLTLVDPNYAPAYKLFAEIYSLLGDNEQSEIYSAIYSSLDR
ncbi:MAG: hypothetical protein K0U19_06275 [Proteobacteria bacterium]|nr:hypothetical protein [Pseudomonadota bacterium]